MGSIAPAIKSLRLQKKHSIKMFICSRMRRKYNFIIRIADSVNDKKQCTGGMRKMCGHGGVC